MYQRSPETIAKIQAHSRKMWANSEYRAKRHASLKASWTPERRAVYATRKKAWWAEQRRVQQAKQAIIDEIENLKRNEEPKEQHD